MKRVFASAALARLELSICSAWYDPLALMQLSEKHWE